MRNNICRVCGKEFTSLKVHLHKNEKKLLMEKPKSLSLDFKDIKPDHIKLYEKIKNSLDLKDGSKFKCFCGGEILDWEWIDDYGYSLKISCDRCGFIWDEY